MPGREKATIVLQGHGASVAVTIYRVGEAGATVFDAGGRVLRHLLPGEIVVEGTIEQGGSAAQQFERLGRKRLAGYADKRIAPETYEDKAR